MLLFVSHTWDFSMLKGQNEPKEEKIERRISNPNKMSQISAKLCSVSFSTQRFQAKVCTENQNLAKWIIACAAMMTLCDPYVYCPTYCCVPIILSFFKYNIV